MIRVSLLRQIDLPTTARDTITRTSLFASPDFLDIWRTWRRRAEYWFCYDSDAPVAALAGIHSRSLFGTSFVSLPDGLYSRVIPLNEKNDRVYDTTLFEALRARRYHHVHFYDFHGSCALDSLFKRNPIIVDLITHLTPDWEPPDPTLKSEIRKGEREGVTVARYDHESHQEGFFALSSETNKRHESKSKYSRNFYNRLATLADSESRICWRVAMHGGVIVAAHIFLIENNLALHWQVCSSRRFAHLKANQVLFFCVARELAARGVTQISLGGTPPGAEGLSQYKSRWGGESYTYTCWTAR